MNKQRKLKISLQEAFPEIAAQWHPSLNGELTSAITPGGNTKYWWLCGKNSAHEWQATCSDRTGKHKSKCPFCSNRRVHVSNSLAIIFPDITKEWHPTKNGRLTPFDVTMASTKKVWWLCLKTTGHEWITAVGNRTRSKQGCPFCVNKRVTLENNLEFLYPSLSKEWHQEKNNPLKPSDVTPGSDKKVWWQCSKNKEHEWQATCKSRTSKNSKCPFCARKKVTLPTSLATLYPQLVLEWHSNKNTLNPADILPGSRELIWWQCLENSEHEWQTRCADRTGKRNRGCPFCSGHKVSARTSLASTHPEIAKEWHPIKNETLKATDVSAGSNKKIWWQCSKDSGHEWQAACCDRAGRNRGCPFCNSGWTIENIRRFVRGLLPYLDSLDPADLYDLFQDEGLLSSNGKCKAFVQALKTGRFPRNELENFVNNKPSLVDEFIENQKMTLDGQEEELGEMPEEGLLYDVEDLPVVQTKDVFALLESNILASSDTEKMDYFVKKACAKIWQHTYLNEREAQVQIAQYHGDNEYAKRVRDLFCKEYEGAKSLEIPAGYSFPEQPNLMQRYLAYLIKTERRKGNWSDPGTGKTLSAILASRVIGANLTVICCPNNVIDTWQRQLKQAYPDSLIYTKESILSLPKHPKKNVYLILNYEFFQQPTSEKKLKQLIEERGIDFIVIDEIHYSKQRKPEQESKRKKLISAFLSEASRKNERICVLGMSATPVINDLFEGKTLIELVTGVHHSELDTRRTVKNCVALYKKFVLHGVRYVPKYNYKPNVITEEIDCSSSLPLFKGYKTYVALEGILTQIKIPYLLKQLRPKTIVYTHYREGIEIPLQEAITKNGWKVALFNGDTKTGLEEFIDGDADILIASSCVGTGVDRLQYVCSRLIINCLPWTHAEFKQLICRIYRQGQKSEQVDIFIPLTFVEINGERKSRCGYRWECIKRKKTFADAAVDGTIPEGSLKTPEQVHKEFMLWLQQVESGDINEIERQKIVLSLTGDIKKTAVRRISDLSQMNLQINHETSQDAHQRFIKNPQSWHEYHEAYREARKEWEVIPYEEAITFCKKRPDWFVGDFGCGEAFLAQELENKVYSFDHVALHEKVIACDMVRVPLEDSCLDVAVFSLSLMGTNFIDYLREARRCLKVHGHLWIAEPISRMRDAGQFKELLERLGFDVRGANQKGKFTFMEALKSDREINEEVLKDLMGAGILE